MEALFLKLLNMSLSASWLVLAVLALRLVLRKAPKWAACLLWALVAVRLVCPFSIESALSLIPSAEPLPQETLYAAHPRLDTGIPSLNAATAPVMESAFAPPPASANPMQIYVYFGAWLWFAGIAAMLLRALVSWLRLRRRVAASLPLRENILLCDDIDSPFILGVFRPRVYLPSNLTEPQFSYVVAHEQAHLARRDHWWKPLGYLLLAAYWFNPLLWLAYVLLCRDIELACDERVVRELGQSERVDYSQTLLDQSRPHRAIAACPLAFGEVGVGVRVKAVLRYRKPAFWAVAGAVVVCVIAAVCFLTNPESSEWLENDDAVLAYVMEHYDVDGEEIVSGKYEMAGADVSSQGYKSFTVYTADGDEYWLQANGVWRKTLFGYRFGPAMKVTDVTYRLLRRGEDAPSSAGMQMESNWDEVREFQMPEFPDAVFILTPENLAAKDADGEQTLIAGGAGMYIRDVCLFDLTGDGIPELCANVSVGSGIVDERVIVYDYAAGQSCELSDLPYHDYTLYAQDGTLYVAKRERDTGKVRGGVPVIEDGELHFRYLGEQGQSLDEAIHEAIMAHNNGRFLGGEIKTESHMLVGQTWDGGVVTARLWTVYQEFDFKGTDEDGGILLEAVSGGASPAVLTFRANGTWTAYELLEYWTPRDGAYFEEDYEEKFMADYEEYREVVEAGALWQECRIKAEAEWREKNG